MIFFGLGETAPGAAALKGMRLMTKVPAISLTLAICFAAPIVGAIVAALTDHAASYPSNRVERRQLAMQQSYRGQLPLPVKALKAPDIPVNVLAANLDASERADAASPLSARTLARNPALIGSRSQLERRVAKLE
jgi:hypothetical protein